MAVTSSITVDDLDLPPDPTGYTVGLTILNEDDVVIVYAPMRGDGKAELKTVDGSYRLTFVHVPLNDGVSMHEREWFDDLGAAVDQLATWMGVDTDEFLDTRSGVNG